MNLGRNFKKIRKDKRLTLVEVATTTGIDIATLSRIENGKMTGTIQSHLAIAKALDVHLPELYEQVFDSEDNPETPNEEQIYSQSDGSVTEILINRVKDKKMMPVRLTLRGGQSTNIEQLPAGTERFVYCLSGKVVVKVRDKESTLNVGESLYFVSSVKHSFSNPQKNSTVCLITTSPPI